MPASVIKTNSRQLSPWAPTPESVPKAYSGDLTRGLPEGSSSGIWRIPGVKHKGNTDEYAVVVSNV